MRTPRTTKAQTNQPMNSPTPEQIAKLPRWTQDHIITLQRERDNAVQALKDFCDAETPSPIFYDDLVSDGDKIGPSVRRKYIQNRKLEILHHGVSLSILLARKDDGQRNGGIQLQWTAEKRQMNGQVAAIPTGFQMIELVAKENMR